jgi:dihydrofolate reductase
VSVVRQLLDAGLLDELHLFVHPATAGSGLKLFEEGAPAQHLKLISSQPFNTGVVYLV